MQFQGQLFTVMSGAQCTLSNEENISDKVLHCSISGNSVEEKKLLVQNFSEKTS
jgi:hypothetical protein